MASINLWGIKKYHLRAGAGAHGGRSAVYAIASLATSARMSVFCSMAKKYSLERAQWKRQWETALM
jgi:hypothetical protein